MLSKARLLILAGPVLFLAATLSGCGGSEKVPVAPPVTTVASPEKAPAKKAPTKKPAAKKKAAPKKTEAE